jgi:hypothetical protein
MCGTKTGEDTQPPIGCGKLMLNAKSKTKETKGKL